MTTSSPALPMPLWVALHAPGTRADMRTAEDPDRAEDLHAVWKSVFEHVKALGPRTDGHEPELAVATGSRQGGRPELVLADPARAGTHRAAGPWVRPGPADVAAGTAALGDVAKDKTEAPAAGRLVVPWAPSPSACQAAAPPLPCVTADGSPHATVRTAAALPPTSFATAPEPVPSAVKVVVSDDTVVVVARDGELSETQALRCAFEVAQRLTGLRSSLQQLTLNGRTVYRQVPDPAPNPAGQAAPRLVFAC